MHRMSSAHLLRGATASTVRAAPAAPAWCALLLLQPVAHLLRRRGDEEGRGGAGEEAVEVRRAPRDARARRPVSPHAPRQALPRPCRPGVRHSLTAPAPAYCRDAEAKLETYGRQPTTGERPLASHPGNTQARDVRPAGRIKLINTR
jgi:hypothetical protein